MSYEGLYIHVPFCTSKCDYCGFYSEAVHDSALRIAFLGRIQADLEGAGEAIRHVNSIYFGGGTPTCLNEKELRELCRMIRALGLEEGTCTEWTCECNPDTLSDTKLDIMAEAGVTRISLGIQTLVPSLRDALGRHGIVPDIGKLAGDVRTRGIRMLNADLIYGIPGQTLSDLYRDLRTVLGSGVDHLSAYALTIEKNSRLARRQLGEYGENAEIEAWNGIETVCDEYGLSRYEVSNYARPGCECRHNMSVWHGGTYLGVGPSASSFDGAVRWTQRANIRDWLAGKPPDLDCLDTDARAAEILAFGMRTTAGWDEEAFFLRTGRHITHLRGREISQMIDLGLLERRGGVIAPTERGLLLNDTLLSALI